MKARVKISDLKDRLFDLNESKGFPAEPYSKQGGRLEANVNTFYLSQAYGGYNVYQMVNKSGAVREPAGGGHVTKRECLERINSLFWS